AAAMLLGGDRGGSESLTSPRSRPAAPRTALAPSATPPRSFAELAVTATPAARRRPPAPRPPAVPRRAPRTRPAREPPLERPTPGGRAPARRGCGRRRRSAGSAAA